MKIAELDRHIPYLMKIRILIIDCLFFVSSRFAFYIVEIVVNSEASLFQFATLFALNELEVDVLAYR